MTDNATSLAKLLKRAKKYSKTTFELFELISIDKSADVVSQLVSRLAILTIVAMSVIIIIIGFALWIGMLLGDSFYGYFIIVVFSIISISGYSSCFPASTD